jgi:hypothetical protein
MDTFTLTVVTKDNAGHDRPDHLDKVREELAERAYISGWSESHGAGVWTMKDGTLNFEPHVLITIHQDGNPEGRFHQQWVDAVLTILGRIGREAMPDQEDIMVTHTTTDVRFL